MHITKQRGVVFPVATTIFGPDDHGETISQPGVRMARSRESSSSKIGPLLL